MNRRSLDVHDYEAHRLFAEIESFLGPNEVDKRLASIALECRIESGTYLKEWVLPRRAWWLGLAQARQELAAGRPLQGAITPLMELPLQTAAKLSILKPSLPQSRWNDYRGRILGDDVLEPTLFEIDCGAHFWALGYDVQWLEQPIGGGKVAEFTATAGAVQFDVECKSKGADAGRRIERAAFYRLIDQAAPTLRRKALTGSISIVMAGKIPTSEQWRRQVAVVIENDVHASAGSTQIQGGGRLDYDCVPATGAPIPLPEIIARLDPKGHTYAHTAIHGVPGGNAVSDPITFRVESATPDTFLQSVLADLRVADHQLTGDRPGVILCRLPEIESFEGLQSDSALHAMSFTFFEKHAGPQVYAVSYVSEARRVVHDNIVLTDMPSITFRSHKFEGGLPADLTLYA